MADPDLDVLLALLRDPNVESRQIAERVGCPREEAGRACRLVLGIARAKPEDVMTLPGLLAAVAAHAAIAAGRADLLASLAGHPAREAAKEARRGLHLLKTRGVAVPEPPAAPAAAARAAEPEPTLHAYASAIDGHGERAVWLPRIVPGKGVEVAQAVLSDERGFVELQLATIGRKEWRLFARGLMERGATMGVAALDPPLAHAMIAAARALGDRCGQRLPPGADRWLGQLGPPPELPDPAAAFPALPDDEEREAVEQSGRLHDLPLLRGWVVEEGSFDAARTARFAARLFETAAHLLRAGDAAHARLAAAAARALARGAPPHAVPVARLLLQKAVHEGERAGPLPAPGPLVVPPGV